MDLARLHRLLQAMSHLLFFSFSKNAAEFLIIFIAQFTACWPAELRVEGSIPDRGRQQWRGGKCCSRVPFSVRDVNTSIRCVKILVHVIEASGKQN